jgi:hypothetical protein
MSSFIGQEMALPLDQLIGAPLQAVIKAQATAANTTANFITSVGMTKTGQDYKARTVSFSFDRQKVTATGATTTETVNLNVPFLTILPVPFIRIQQATIIFDAKVSSTTIDTSKTNFAIDASASGGFFGFDFSVNTSFSTTSTHSNEVDRSANLHVEVIAVKDKMPEGLAKILNILQTAITDSAAAPTPAPTPTP